MGSPQNRRRLGLERFNNAVAGFVGRSPSQIPVVILSEAKNPS
jgi:hypothetical protein